MAESNELRLIDKNGGEVTAFDDARTRHFVKGNKDTNDIGGVYAQLTSNPFKLSYVGKQIIIGQGVGILWGRRFEIPANETRTINVTGSGTQYITIYLVLDTSNSANEKIIVRAVQAQNAYSTKYGFKSDNLILNNFGTAVMELYRVKVTVNSSDLLVLEEKQMFHLLRDNYVYNAEIADEAKSLPYGSLIGGQKVDNVIMPYYGGRVFESDNTNKVSGNSITNDLGLSGMLYADTYPYYPRIPFVYTLARSYSVDNTEFGCPLASDTTLDSVNISNLYVIAVFLSYNHIETSHNLAPAYYHDVYTMQQIKNNKAFHNIYGCLKLILSGNKLNLVYTHYKSSFDRLSAYAINQVECYVLCMKH